MPPPSGQHEKEGIFLRKDERFDRFFFHQSNIKSHGPDNAEDPRAIYVNMFGSVNLDDYSTWMF